MNVGIVLYGTEIKSIRKGKVNLKDSFAKIYNGECFVIGMHISPYEFGNINNKKLFINDCFNLKKIGKINNFFEIYLKDQQNVMNKKSKKLLK